MYLRIGGVLPAPHASVSQLSVSHHPFMNVTAIGEHPVDALKTFRPFSPPPSDPCALGPADQGVGVQDSGERLQRRPSGRAGPVERPDHHAVPAGTRRPHLGLPVRAQRVSTTCEGKPLASVGVGRLPVNKSVELFYY